MIPIVWTRQALEDVDAIQRFIARDSIRYADLIASRIMRAVDRLAEFPQSGRVVPELRKGEIREVIYERYRLVYRIKPTVIQVLTVFHGARSFPSDIPRP